MNVSRAYLSLCADARSQGEQGFVGVVCCGELHSGSGSGHCDDGDAGETEGCCVAKDAGASLALVCTGDEARDGCGGKDEQFVLGEQRIDGGAEGSVTRAECGDLVVCDASAPREPLTDGGLELIVMTGVDASGFPRLDGREEVEGAGPVGGVECGAAEAERFELACEAL